MSDRSSSGVLIPALASTAVCSKNYARSPGLIESVAGNEMDAAGNTVDGVGKDVTNTLDASPPGSPPRVRRSRSAGCRGRGR